MAALLTLRSTYHRTPFRHGCVTLWLAHQGDEPLGGFSLALTSIVQLSPRPDGEIRLARRVSGYHELAFPPGFTLDPGTEVELRGFVAGHVPQHGNDGPASVFVILADGSTIAAETVPMVRDGTDAAEGAPDPPRGVAAHPADAPPVALLPWPASIHVDGGPRPPSRAALAPGAGDVVADVWQVVAAAERRLRPAGASALAVGDEPARSTVTAAVVPGIAPPGGYRVTIDDDALEVVAADVDGLRHGLVTVAQLLAGACPARVRIADHPTFGWRGLHVDLARQWFDPDLVARIVDVAAWRKLDRLHLHLTDDEAWRVPVVGHPELTDIGAWRGHGRPIPPLLGSPAAATGGAYEPDALRRWVARGHDLGVVIVPEVDLPGHCHAALTALPSLRDPADASRARSVQHFVDNVLVPGLPATTAFVEAVVGSLATWFDAPWLHVGADEVPAGAWRGSPAAVEYAAARGVAGVDAVAASFVADVVAAVRQVAGRQVGVWQEAAEIGGVRPGEGYAVAWKPGAGGRELAAAGHDVVLSPPDAYYLDMAVDDRWSTPGASWAGHVDLAATCAFEPGAGWPTDARRRLLGVQACLWTEHVRSPADVDRMSFPRLDAVAERAWLGRIEGGPASIAARGATLPRVSG